MPNQNFHFLKAVHRYRNAFIFQDWISDDASNKYSSHGVSSDLSCGGRLALGEILTCDKFSVIKMF